MSDVSAIPYMSFPGNAREAMNFYAELLEAQLDLLEVGQMQPEADNPHAIMHAYLHTDFGLKLMGADDVMGQGVSQGGPITITLNCQMDRFEYAERVFAGLSEGGTVHVPFARQMWGAVYGNCEDRYGIKWAINCEE